MSIIWKYLDKRSAAVDALKDYSSMEFIIANTSSEIKNTRDKMSGVRSPQFDGMLQTGGGIHGMVQACMGAAE